MKNNLLQNDIKWLPYQGEQLSVDGYMQVIKIKIDTHYHKINSSILSAQEIEKANRFRQQQDRERYLVSKYYLRLLLAQFLSLAPSAIEYSYTGNYKPTVPGIEFNISHAENYVVIGICRFKIGVDVEYIKRDFDFNDLMELCFSPEEASFINHSEDHPLGFYLLWTRKEAILKATAEGLTDHLNQVATLQEETLREGQPLKIISITTSDGYVITAAFPAHQKITVHFWHWE